MIFGIAWESAWFDPEAADSGMLGPPLGPRCLFSGIAKRKRGALAPSNFSFHEVALAASPRAHSHCTRFLGLSDGILCAAARE